MCHMRHGWQQVTLPVDCTCSVTSQFWMKSTTHCLLQGKTPCGHHEQADAHVGRIRHDIVIELLVGDDLPQKERVVCLVLAPLSISIRNASASTHAANAAHLLRVAPAPLALQQLAGCVAIGICMVQSFYHSGCNIHQGDRWLSSCCLLVGYQLLLAQTSPYRQMVRLEPHWSGVAALTYAKCEIAPASKAHAKPRRRAVCIAFAKAVLQSEQGVCSLQPHPCLCGSR